MPPPPSEIEDLLLLRAINSTFHTNYRLDELDAMDAYEVSRMTAVVEALNESASGQ